MTVLAVAFLAVTTYFCAVGLGGAYLEALEVGRVTWLTQWVSFPLFTLLWLALTVPPIIGLVDGDKKEESWAAWHIILFCLTALLPLLLTQFEELYPYRFRPLYVGGAVLVVQFMVEYGNNRAKQWQTPLPTPES